MVFKDEITDEIADLHVKNLTTFWNPDTNSLTARYNIGGTFRGFAARLDDKTLAAELESPHLAHIEVDQEVVMYSYSNCHSESLINSGLWVKLFRTTQEKKRSSKRLTFF